MSRSTNATDYQMVPVEVAGMPKEYPDRYENLPHSHIRHQLVYGTKGVMEVKAEGGAWFVPPQKALWIPAGTMHSTRMHGRVSLRTLYIDPAHTPETAPKRPCLVRVSPLLRELILRVMELPLERAFDRRERQIVDLSLGELEWSDMKPITLTTPLDPRLRKIHSGIVVHPDDTRSLSDWASIVGATPRTLTRLCQSEFGLAFRDWRQLLKLSLAIPRIAAGISIGVIASEMGFETASAFSAMFRRYYGTTPTQFLHG